MLLNAYLLAKIGADTAENEQHFAENLPKIGNYPTGSCPFYGEERGEEAAGLRRPPADAAIQRTSRAGLGAALLASFLLRKPLTRSIRFTCVHIPLHLSDLN